MQTRTKAHLSVMLANLIFGVTFSMVKLLVPVYMTSFALNVVRIAVSLPLFWFLFALRPGRAGIDRMDIPRFVLCGLCGVAVNQIFFIKGLSLTSTIHGSLLALGTPVFITAAAAWLLHEKFTWNKGAGLILGILGAAMLVLSRSGFREGSSVWLGDTLVLINSLSYALYFVWVKPLMQKYSTIHVIRWIFVFGGIMILPFGWQDFVNTPFSTLPALAWVAMGFVAIGATFVAYLCNMYGLNHLGPAVTGSYIYTQPMFAAIISVVFLNEDFGVHQVLAGGMIALGVYLVNIHRGGTKPAPEAEAA